MTPRSNPISSSRLVLAAAAFLLVFGSPWAQEPDSIYLPEWSGWYNSADPRSTESIRAKYRPQLDRFELDSVFTALRQDFFRATADWAGDDSVAAQRFLIEWDQLLSEIKNTMITARYSAGYPVDLILKDVKTVRFKEDADHYGLLVFFLGETTEVLPRAFSGEPLLDSAQTAELRYAARAIRGVLIQEVLRPAYMNAASAIEQAEIRWRNYLQEGVSQYPWEVLVNGLLPSGGIQYPPRYQLMFLHPELSLEFHTEKLDRLMPVEAMSVDLLGLVFYNDADYSDFWGVSAISTHRSDIGVGLGARLRFGSTVNAGVTWHDLDDDGKYFDQAPYVVLSLDFFRLLQTKSAELAEIRDRIRKGYGQLGQLVP